MHLIDKRRWTSKAAIARDVGVSVPVIDRLVDDGMIRQMVPPGFRRPLFSLDDARKLCININEEIA